MWEGVVDIKSQAFATFVVLFVIVVVLGFLAARWRRADLGVLEEWGLAGRRLGTWMTWLFLGGDLYTAYAFLAVPALVYGVGAFGFFAVPYMILLYPIMFVVMPRLWRVCKANGFVTPADFVRSRFDSRPMSFAVAITGIVSTMPYIALQLVAIQAVLVAMGVGGSGSTKDLPLFVVFAILAGYTYSAGIRASVVTSVVKDVLLYATVIVVILVIPAKLGGFSHVFSVSQTALSVKNGSVSLSPKLYGAFSTLAIGSAFALLLYPHAITGTLSARSGHVIRKSAVMLPLFSIAFAIVALLGFMALGAGIGTSAASELVPLLLLKTLPQWFVGVAFAGIAVGALIPASIMSISAGNLFSKNIYGDFFRRDATPEEEARVAKLVALIVKFGALVLVVAIPLRYAIYLQTLGGIWILQTGPAVIGGLWTRWFHKKALFLGWLVGMTWGTYMAYTLKFSSTTYSLDIFGRSELGYAAVWAALANLLTVVIMSIVLNRVQIRSSVVGTGPGGSRSGALASGPLETR